MRSLGLSQKNFRVSCGKVESLPRVLFFSQRPYFACIVMNLASFPQLWLSGDKKNLSKITFAYIFAVLVLVGFFYWRCCSVYNKTNCLLRKTPLPPPPLKMISRNYSIIADKAICWRLLCTQLTRCSGSFVTSRLPLLKL